MNELLRRIATGDESAIIEFTERYEQKIVNYFWVRIRCYHTAEDLAQDALMKIIKSAGLYNPALGEASSWVSVLCRHIWIDFGRRKNVIGVRAMQARTAVPMYEEDTGLPRQIASDEMSPLCRAEAKDTLEQIRKHLPELNTDQADVLRRYCDGESLPQIAEELHLCVPTVKSRLRLGKERLRMLTRAIAK
ncbi:RpoE DNA-directed RNA polymerase specialized sigma subunit, sigma24 homolog [uncultured Caudovirales phage]|uniref:RpoE DNA-directed RNA polymerase specialized sigma subunit, sigma24 homolog n=1 Tax=uncultured Caudovirales phage TaxID=2100421 RepID=A0A6J5R262_9CAUD|nr:RpoE DNA-directed RNA polymerase specialized sigma subunit, sigma24 homolog [uncultured Caudovirales phage]